jgi:hypothetical protein
VLTAFCCYRRCEVFRWRSLTRTSTRLSVCKEYCTGIGVPGRFGQLMSDHVEWLSSPLNRWSWKRVRKVTMANVRTQKVTESFIAIDKPIKLEETSRTRRISLPSFSVDDGGNKHLRGDFIRQRKGRSGWEDEEGISLKDVAPGEAVKFELPSEAMGRFLEGVGALLKVAQMPSLEERSQRFSIAPSNRVIEINDETLKPAIQELIAKGHTREFLDQLALLKPQDAEMFADEQLLRRRSD